MAIEDFFPFRDGQVVTTAQWNELISKIFDGSAIASPGTIGNLDDRVTALESRVNALSSLAGNILVKEVIRLSPGQTTITLHSNVIPGSEVIFFDSIMLIKQDSQNNEEGDYYMEDNVIFFTPSMVADISGNEYLVMLYRSKVI